jgi:hypothetical protein
MSSVHVNVIENSIKLGVDFMDACAERDISTELGVDVKCACERNGDQHRPL